jgi:hypothetical protein
MALSPNYAWAEPDNSSLVKNGAQDIRALGDAIDTSVWNVGYGQAGKNKIINGDMGIWQRGTSFASIFAAYTADRFLSGYGTGGTQSIARQEVTGATGLPDYIRYAMRYSTTVAATTRYAVTQRVEDVQTLAGQTVTVSFYAKKISGTPSTLTLNVFQIFGSGGSTFTQPVLDTDFTITTDFQRFTHTFSMPSMAGKTIGTSSYLDFRIKYPVEVSVFDVTGWQVESGGKATPFQTATGTIQGELSACQRYYYRISFAGAASHLGVGHSDTTTSAALKIFFKTTMRIQPTALEQSGTATDYSVRQAGGSLVCSAVPTFASAGTDDAQVNFTVASGLTAGQGVFGRTAVSGAYLGWSAEL